MLLKTFLLIVSTAILVAFQGATNFSSAQVARPLTKSGEISASDVLPAVLEMKRFTEAGFPSPYIVTDERTFDNAAVLATEELVFYPGSKLILGRTQENRREIFIVARKIRVVPGLPPPTISWQRGLPPSVIPPPVGKAQAGRSATSSGAPGGLGENGAVGNPGYPGAPAPTVYLAVNEVVGGNIYLDLRGQDGGPGGVGQEGGDGGPGMSGHSGTSSLFDCQRGGGDGGPGGKAGDGGPGGEGGQGGDGGTFVLMSSRDNFKMFSSMFYPVLTGGEGGFGGKGGMPGRIGSGGGGGSGSGFCGGGSTGKPGGVGQPGADNSKIKGKSGQPGRSIAIELNDEILSAIKLK